MINLSAVHALSKVDGTPIQEILDLYDSKTTEQGFGPHGASSQCGKFKIISCSCPMKWADRVKIEPRLAEFFIKLGEHPSFLSSGCQNLTTRQAQKIVNVEGKINKTWTKPDEALNGIF